MSVVDRVSTVFKLAEDNQRLAGVVGGGMLMLWIAAQFARGRSR